MIDWCIDLCYFDLRCVPHVFLFKQKTAYEMRISDWSSDVCSSDLVADGSRSTHAQLNAMRRLWPNFDGRRHDDGLVIWRGMLKPRAQAYAVNILWWPEKIDRPYVMITDPPIEPRPRSEEHTSELQSLMRISYAVFCLEKKNNSFNTIKTVQHTQDTTP